MRLPPRQSIRARILGLVVLTTGMGLLVAGAAMVTHDLNVYRHNAPLDLSTEASILALSTAPALAFDDHSAAERTLTALKARPTVLAAALYRTDGARYAQFVRQGALAPPARLARLARSVDTVQVRGNRILLTRRITHNGEWLGTIYLLGSYDLLGELWAFVGIFSLVMIGGLAGALALSQPLQRRVTVPLEDMAAVARHVMSGEDYTLRAKPPRRDEIGLVVAAFNDMLDQVQSRTTALEQSNRTLQAEIEVRHVAEAALSQANASLENAMTALRETDRRKDEFLATLAHELRNPLAPVRHAVKLLALPSIGEAQRQWGREVIARQVERMALLLEDLLDISRITRGRLELKKEHVELASIVASAVETARPLIEGKRQHLQLDLPAEAIELDVDPLRLSQTLANLLTNAAKYTDEHGHIRVAAKLQPDALVLSVADDGIGISAGALPTLFEMFSQVESAMDRAQGGLGIGLALVKGLVALHGGTVAATSRGPGLGSTFSVRLPRDLIVHRPVGAHADVTRQSLPCSMGCRVLIADDNRDAADSLAMILTAAGNRVCIAYSGTDAWTLAAREQPDALILDIGMPGMNGYEVAQHVRRESWGRRALLLAATGWGQQDDKERARSAGFDQHLTKPIDPDQVIRLLSSIAARSKLPPAAAGIRD